MNRRDIIIIIIFGVCFGLWLLFAILYGYCVSAFGLIVSFAVALLALLLLLIVLVVLSLVHERFGAWGDVRVF